MSVRTDLAYEGISAEGALPEGIKRSVRNSTGCEITEIIVETDKAGESIGKLRGKYVTVETDRLSAYPEEFDEMAKGIGKEISAFLPSEGTVLVIGLGNSDITPDALGPMTVSGILATRHLKGELPPGHALGELRGVAAIAPGVLGQTGMEVAEIAKAVCEEIRPAAAVVIDALACGDVNRLGCTIQLTDTGISPGSGVQNRRKELSERTLGVPVVAVGVPTVVDMHTIAENLTGKAADRTLPNMMVTPRDIDQLIERTAKLISFSLNMAFQPTLTPEDITALT